MMTADEVYDALQTQQADKPTGQGLTDLVKKGFEPDDKLEEED